MKFTHKAMSFDVGIFIERNIITATHIDKSKVHYYLDPATGKPTKAMNYSDFLSVSLPLSDFCRENEDSQNPFEAIRCKYWNEVVQKLCIKIDEKSAQ